ncbi:MAG: PQQ-like beta-propeller repeat protein [Planctomycetia bacterium]|nr:PQQ-like beta-propeller repeat protein [Planctomycetia bacterium]
MSSAAVAEDTWPEFRGPGAQGRATTLGLPLNWSEQQNVVWKSPVPGRGWSSPAIAGNRIWMTTAIEHPLTKAEIEERIRKSPVRSPGLTASGPMSMRLLCIDRQTGKPLYDVELFHIETPDPLHTVNSYASPSPIWEAGRVYCHFGTYGTACVEADTGHVVWKQRFPINHVVGPGSSPVLFENLLVIPCDGADQQYVIALDKKTGETVWKKDRPKIDSPSPDMRKSFCTPLVIEHAGRPQLILPGAQWFVSYDPRTGDELWRVNHGSGFSIVPRPVYANGLVYVCNGFGKANLFAIRVDGTGDVTKTHIAWKSDKQIPLKPSPLLHDGLLYVVSDNGVATCFDAVTGKTRWTKRLPGAYSASPLFAEGRIYFFNEDGTATVIKPGPHFEQLAANKLDEGCMASAAALAGAMYLRTEKHLYRIEERPAVGATSGRGVE